jgi:hypothetical protein
MLAYYMDHQFPATVTRELRRRGVDVLTALEDGTATLDDELLLARATVLNRVVVTHDKGFLRLAGRWQWDLRDFPGVVFAVQRSFDIGNAIANLELIAHVMTPAEMRCRVEYLPSH